MANNLKYCIDLLQDNEESVKSEAKRILLKLCDNILKYPNEMRYRKIYLSDALVSNHLMPAAGAIECLFEAGFIENDDGFLLPVKDSLTGIKELHDFLNNKRNSTKSQAKSNLPANMQKISNTTKNLNSIKENKEFSKSTFLMQLLGYFQDILKYEDKNLQEKVKLILPLEKLQIQAMENLRKIQREMKITNIQNDVVIEDLLLNELLKWFKFKFFKWVDSPACSNCMGECSFYETIPPSNSHKYRIEIHKCKSCGYKNEFPRYNDPEVLLYTRKGRCGEWAMCFTFICRAVGFDARFVLDTTDHVWTEVWSNAHNKWIHADACENAMDQPLMYEKGWGKKLSYIIAFSKDEIQDVTWRYTRNFNDVMKRRNQISEESLMLFINKVNVIRQNSKDYSEARKKYVVKRTALELAEMIKAPPSLKKPNEILENENNYGGRTSGSLAWRISRGEVNNIEFNAMQWNIPQGVSNFELEYSIINDAYVAKDSASGNILETKEKWQNGIELLEGQIFRKKEEDWQMVYLARSSETDVAKITWSFVIEDSVNMCVNSVKLQAGTATFNGASIEWKIEGFIYNSNNTLESNKLISISDGKNFETNNLKGTIKISVSAILSGGKGKLAWQHAQLFRQSLKTNVEVPSLLIKIDLSNKILT